MVFVKDWLCKWLKELDNGYCQGLVMQVALGTRLWLLTRIGYASGLRN